MKKSAKHEALPQTMTPENLAFWLTENKIDSRIYTKKTELSQDDIANYEHKSSVASRNIDTLEELKKQFADLITGGTEEPKSMTVPQTKGTKVLHANRKFADNCIKNGYEELEIELFAIPWPEEEKIVWFDSEGHPFDGTTLERDGEKPFTTENLTTDMTDEQKDLYNKPLLKEVKETGKKVRKNYMEEDKEGTEVDI